MPAKRLPRRPTPVDVTVGRNVRVWRIARGLSQTQLADRLGVTFQQVQKYESGGNRMGAGRLVKAAATLGIPVSALFAEDGGADPSRSLLALVADRLPYRLAHAFAAIEHRGLRLALVKLVENVAAALARPIRRRTVSRIRRR